MAGRGAHALTHRLALDTVGYRSTVKRLAALVVALAPVLGACARGGSDPPAVVLLGDSLAQQIAPYLQDQIGDAPLLNRYFGGTAPCDWFGKDLMATSDRTVVVSFTGNSETPCMADDHGIQRHGQALVDQYRQDLTALVGQIRDRGASVVLVLQPPRGPARGAQAAREVAGINAIYTDLASADEVTLANAGAAVSTPDGRFTITLPCLPHEAACGPDGTNAVRSEDGVHLCPGTGPRPCEGYASGAYRFAHAIADAIKAR